MTDSPTIIDLPIKWHNEYALGIDRIDQQHMALLVLLNRLHELATLNRYGEVPCVFILNALHDLSAYAAFHFLTEESLLNQHLSTTVETVRHIAAHRSYWSIVSDFRHRVENKNVTDELVSFVSHWWIEHILGIDREMGEVLLRLDIH